ncbi:hypothetical protein EXIGLDRAFT_784780 [Exidia glandulosa HHB12029]|uniref:Uncharacterized protein n=1 Tax=Exidia glandulosa HHB12029 TaxID=1314781 RepID=A0A166MA99_EXIGL|nr:hypothetical protein EXIGLDRAFT_784780 [Exidia glandulosa HHB12029]
MPRTSTVRTQPHRARGRRRRVTRSPTSTPASQNTRTTLSPSRYCHARSRIHKGRALGAPSRTALAAAVDAPPPALAHPQYNTRLDDDLVAFEPRALARATLAGAALSPSSLAFSSTAITRAALARAPPPEPSGTFRADLARVKAAACAGTARTVDGYAVCERVRARADAKR